METVRHDSHRVSGHSSYVQHQAGDEHVRLALSGVVFSFDGSQLRVLTIRGPQGALQLPHRSFDTVYSLQKVTKLLLEDTLGSHAHVCEPSQTGLFSQTGSGHALVGSFYTIVPRHVLNETSQHAQFQWSQLSEVASGDATINEQVLAALRHLRMRARFESVAFSFLPQEFSLSELQHLFEAIIGREIDVRNFRKKIDSLDILSETARRQTGLAHRPPKLFQFDGNKFAKRVTSEGEVRFF